MSEIQEVTLETAQPSDAALLGNLLQLYLHDLSEVFPIDVARDGRFGYDSLPLYWQEPERRFPFLIRLGGRVSGFALVKRALTPDDPDDLDVAEFFVLRRYRRLGVGRQAAFLLWNRIAGSWIVRVSEGNNRALKFWPVVIREYTRGAFSESTRSGAPHAWRVFAFQSSDAAARR